jgi:hypothetical protein
MTTAPVQLVDIDLIASDFLHLTSLRQAMECFTIPSVPAETAAAIRPVRDRASLKLVFGRVTTEGSNP